MPEPTAPEPSRTPDVETIRHLVRLMHRYDLTAIDLIEGATQIRLRRRREAPAGPDVAPSTAPAAPSAPAPPAASTGPAPTAAAEPPGLQIESPMVGTFYAAPAPDAPPFITVGSAVRPDTIVGVIEAMKVFTEIPAGVTGTVAEVLVKNGQSVDFGLPLFRVHPD